MRLIRPLLTRSKSLEVHHVEQAATDPAQVVGIEILVADASQRGVAGSPRDPGDDAGLGAGLAEDQVRGPVGIDGRAGQAPHAVEGHDDPGALGSRVRHPPVLDRNSILAVEQPRDWPAQRPPPRSGSPPAASAPRGSPKAGGHPVQVVSLTRSSHTPNPRHDRQVPSVAKEPDLR